jgi:hypothetical protein
MQRAARIEIVYKRLFAMNRMLRRSCYKQMDSEDMTRELLEASSSDSEPNSDTDSESSVESGGSGPSHNVGEGRSVPDQFTICNPLTPILRFPVVEFVAKNGSDDIKPKCSHGKPQFI